MDQRGEVFNLKVKNETISSMLRSILELDVKLFKKNISYIIENEIIIDLDSLINYGDYVENVFPQYYKGTVFGFALLRILSIGVISHPEIPQYKKCFQILQILKEKGGAYPESLCVVDSKPYAQTARTPLRLILTWGVYPTNEEETSKRLHDMQSIGALGMLWQFFDLDTNKLDAEYHYDESLLYLAASNEKKDCFDFLVSKGETFDEEKDCMGRLPVIFLAIINEAIYKMIAEYDNCKLKYNPNAIADYHSFFPFYIPPGPTHYHATHDKDNTDSSSSGSSSHKKWGTALHAILELKQWDKIPRLVKCKLDPTTKDSDGKTALEYLKDDIIPSIQAKMYSIISNTSPYYHSNYDDDDDDDDDDDYTAMEKNFVCSQQVIGYISCWIHFHPLINSEQSAATATATDATAATAADAENAAVISSAKKRAAVSSPSYVSITTRPVAVRYNQSTRMSSKDSEDVKKLKDTYLTRTNTTVKKAPPTASAKESKSSSSFNNQSSDDDEVVEDNSSSVGNESDEEIVQESRKKTSATSKASAAVKPSSSNSQMKSEPSRNSSSSGSKKGGK